MISPTKQGGGASGCHFELETMNSIIDVESFAIILLVVVSLVALVVNRLHIPYTVALVLVGLVLTFNHSLGAQITPELILTLFIPPIAFEAALHLEADHLTNDLLQIGALAIPGVIIITVIVGGMVAILVPSIPLATAMVFGALISATDPVAVVVLFRSANVSRRLSVLLEAESLLNDGTAIEQAFGFKHHRRSEDHTPEPQPPHHPLCPLLLYNKKHYPPS